MGPPRTGPAGRRLDQLAHPRRARRWQDAGWRGGCARLGADLPDRQSNWRDHRRRPRHHGQGRIRHSRLLPTRRASPLPRRRSSPRMAERRGKRAVLSRGARPAQGQAAHEIVVRRARRLASARRLRSGDAGLAPRRQTAGERHHHAASDAAKDTIVPRGSTFDNKAHLARAFFDRITARYKGRAIGRQELFAEIVEETPGALWSRALLERQRVAPEAAPKEFAEIVVAVDPPARSGTKSDECGLIVAAKAENGLFYVLADLTSQGETPGAWGARVGAAFRNFKANRVVAEINQGGDMVTEVLRQSEPNLPVHAVHATRGKFLRAEPIAAAYERGLVFHIGTFSKLEDQLCALTPDFDRRAMGYSPDRADALVWGLADLLGVGQASAGGMYEFWTGGGGKAADQKAP